MRSQSKGWDLFYYIMKYFIAKRCGKFSYNETGIGKMILCNGHWPTRKKSLREYYGTIHATPLFIMLAEMYSQDTADINTIKKLWPSIKLR